MKLAVIGAGLMGRAAVYDFARIEGVEKVGVFDIDESLAKQVADAYGIPGLRVDHRDEVAPAIEKAMEELGAFIIDFRIEPEENVYPMVQLGGSLVEFLEDEQVRKEAIRA